MNSKQENKLSMYLAVQKVCSDNEGVWNGLVSFDDAFDDFKTNLSALNNALAMQEKKITGITKEKESLQAAMVDRAIAVGGAVFAYAEKEGNKPLQEKVNYAPSDLKNIRDTVRIQRCQLIYDEANTVISNLSDYGVTANDLKKLQNAIADYGKAIAAPRTALTEQKGATAEIARLIEVIDGLLKRRLDKLIENFKKDEPVFYKQYFDARIVVGLGSRNTLLKGIVKNAIDGKSIEKASVELINGNDELFNSTVTNKTGEFIFENLLVGEYTLKVKKEGFEPVEISKVTVERGRMNELSSDVEMKESTK